MSRIPATEAKKLPPSTRDAAAKLDDINIKLEERLRDLGFEIEVWVLAPGRELEREIESLLTDNDDRPESRTVCCTELGYAQVGDRWRLSVRRTRYDQTWMGSCWEYADDGIPDAEFPTPLADESLRVKIAAARLMPSLLDLMREAAEELALASERTAGLVESLTPGTAS